jgi:hypothetical protein
MKGRLSLKAEDPSDLQIVSAALQDAIVRMSDIRYDAKARMFTVIFNRYRWEDAPKRTKSAPGLRIRSGLSVAGVLNVQALNLKRTPKDAVAQLLTIAFAPSDQPEDPGGDLTLEFAGGGKMRLRVECLDILLADVSDPWRARARPDHEKDEA